MAAITTFALSGAGQTPTNSASVVTNYPIKGTIEIRRGVTSPDNKWFGGRDNYTLNITVANSILFRGSIQDYPLVMGGWTGGDVKQSRKLVYDVDCDILNIRNPNVGRIVGTVPVHQDGRYRYDLGNLTFNVLPRNNFLGSEDKFKGVGIGKPLVRPPDYLEKLRSEALSITRSINGKKSVTVLKKYDKMEFSSHNLPAGPAPSYVSGVVSGEMIYEYPKKCWYLNNVIVNSAIGQDRFAGNIRWYKSPTSKGAEEEGEYQFDIRVNEPLPTDAMMFSNTPVVAQDESAFGESAAVVGPSLIGTIVYRNGPNGMTATVDLMGNSLTKQQTMLLTKLFVFSMIVPLNND